MDHRDGGVAAVTDEIDDVDIRRSIHRVAELAITELEVMLREASPAIKSRLLTTMFGKMLPLLSTDASSGTEELRQAMTELFQAVRGDIEGGEDDLSLPPVREDLEEDSA